MMKKNVDPRKTFSQFQQIYSDVVDKILSQWSTEMQIEISQHCIDWAPGKFCFKTYLRLSTLRYYQCYLAVNSRGNIESVCDIGGFLGAFPLTLKRLGVKNVMMTESLKYYSNAFNPLFDLIRAEGVEIIDVDPFQEKIEIGEKCDAIVAMAILEHYPHSPKYFMENIRANLKKGGLVYIEVPNILFWTKRIFMLLGHTPLHEMECIFRSKTPFIGHHHEYSMKELKLIFQLSELSILKGYYYNYSPLPSHTSLMNVLHRYSRLAGSLLFKNTRECIALLGARD